MRLAFAPLALVAALSSGCTIHVVEQPASASAWSAPPPPNTVVVQQPAPTPAAPRPAAAEPPRRLVSRARPSDFGRVTTPPPSSKPHPTEPREPRPTQPVATRPVTTKPASKPPAAETPVDKGWGVYRYTKREQLHPEHARDGSDTNLVRPPVAATR
jgi:hypothetical protein